MADPNVLPDVEIRLAGSDDVSGIATLLAESFAEYRSQYTQRGFEATVLNVELVANRLAEGPIWVAVRNALVMGTVSAVRKGDALYVRGMAVRPAARGLGIGERLLNEIEDYASREGLRRMFLSTTPFLDRAIGLYEKAGFRRVPEGPHDLHSTPLFTMEKLLTRT